MQSHSAVSRRGFLFQAAAVAGSAPFILPGWSAQTPPSNRINLGFIGLGVQGRGLMKGFLGRDGVQAVAVCDVDTKRREDGRNRVEAHYQKQTDRGSFKGCSMDEDFRELVARPEIDGVVIATPDHWHALIEIAAAQAGKDIYCEKPLCKWNTQEVTADGSHIRVTLNGTVIVETGVSELDLDHCLDGAAHPWLRDTFGDLGWLGHANAEEKESPVYFRNLRIKVLP